MIVSTVPPNAQIQAGDGKREKGPLLLNVGDEPITVLVSLEGYEPSSTVVDGSKGKVSVELKPLAGAVDDADDDGPEYKSKTDQWLNFLLHKLHALLWIVVASALAIWTQLYEVVVDGHPPARPHAELSRCARVLLQHAQPAARHVRTRCECPGGCEDLTISPCL